MAGGRIRLNGPTWRNSGTLRAANGGLLDLEPPTGATGTNTGTLLAQSGGTLTAFGTWSNSGTLQAQSSGTLTTRGTWTSTGPINATAATLNLGSDFTGSWSNTGLVTVTSATVRLQGTFTTPGPYRRTGGSVSIEGTVANTGRELLLAGGGMLRVLTGGALITTGNAVIQTGFTNTGTVRVQSGRLDVTGSFSNFAGTTLTGGTFVVGGTLKFTGADIRTNAATLIRDSPGSAVVNQADADALLNFATNAAAGTFAVRNGRTFSRTGSFTNLGTMQVTSAALTFSGRVSVGGTGIAGTLFVIGNYTQTGGAIVDLELSSFDSGDSDQFIITGAAALGGTANVTLLSSFVAREGDLFLPLVFLDGRSGTMFATLNLPNLGGGSRCCRCSMIRSWHCSRSGNRPCGEPGSSGPGGCHSRVRVTRTPTVASVSIGSIR